MVCDPCDLAEVGGAGCPCLAQSMLEVGEIKDVIREWRAKMAKPYALLEYPERRAPRYHLYRAIIKWVFADPLGAENRVRMPTCVKQCVRRMFPNPCCVPVALGGRCDFGAYCEDQCHYVGHLTFEESRMRREGAAAAEVIQESMSI